MKLVSWYDNEWGYSNRMVDLAHFIAKQDGNLKFLFYSSAKMKEIYLRHSDITFINKRFTVNRFKKPILLIFVVTNTGQSALVALALYEREEVSYFARI